VDLNKVNQQVSLVVYHLLPILIHSQFYQNSLSWFQEHLNQLYLLHLLSKTQLLQHKLLKLSKMVKLYNLVHQYNKHSKMHLALLLCIWYPLLLITTTMHRLQKAYSLNQMKKRFIGEHFLVLVKLMDGY
jgi:hypothetical protein